MERALLDPWIITIVGGALATIIPSLIIYLIKRKQTPSIFVLYKRSIRDVSIRLAFSVKDTRILRQVLSDKTVRNVLQNEAFGPDEEIHSLTSAILRIAPPASLLANAEQAATIAEQFIQTEFVAEGKYAVYHESMRYERRRDFFQHRKQPAFSSSTINIQEQKANIQVSSPVQTKSTTQVLPRSFFSLLEHIQGIAENCIGRKQDLNKLNYIIEQGLRRLIVIEGFGGVGKTTLAARFAIDISQLYTVLWMSCGDIEVTTERFLREMGRFASEQYMYTWLTDVVENTALSNTEKLNTLLEFLAFVKNPGNASLEKSLLRPIALFLDDYHLVQDRTLDFFVEKIVESHLDIIVILAIRHRQPLSNKLQIKIDTSNPILLDGLSLADCRSFITAYATSFPALAKLSEETLQLIWKRTGGGVPNVLEICVSMTRTRSLEDILGHLPNYDPLVATTRQQWFDSLFNELSLEEQQVATEIAIFRRPVSRRAIIKVSQCKRADEIIDALVNRFILLFDGSLYAMHALWSDYTKQLHSPNDTQQLHLRAAYFYKESASTDPHTSLMNQIMTQLESCYHFIKAEDIDNTTATLIPIASTLRSWGVYNEILAILLDVEMSAKQMGKHLAPQLLLEHSVVLHEQGEVDQAIAILKELVETNIGEVKINGLNRLAWMYIELGKRREAEQCLNSSRQQANQSGLSMLEADALKGLHHLAYIESNYMKALEYNEERLKILLQHSDDPNAQEPIAMTYRDIGNIYREQGFYKKAMELYQNSISIFHAIGYPPVHTGWLKYDIGQIQFEHDNLKEAQASFEESFRIFKDIRYTHGIAHAMIEIARIRFKIDKNYNAIEQIEEALILIRHLKLISGEAYGLRMLGEIYLYLDKPEQALTHLQQSLDIDENILHGTKGIALTLHYISLAYEQQGKQLMLLEKRQEASKKFHEAKKSIERAKLLLTELNAIVNFDSLLADATRIEKELANTVLDEF